MYQNTTKDNPLRTCKVIYDITFSQMIQSKKTVFMLIVTSLPVLLVVYYRISGREDMVSPDQALSHIMMFFLLFLSILIALLYGTTLIADEIDNKTIAYLFTRPIHKYSIILGKFAAYILGVLLVLIPPMVLTFLIIATDSDMPGDFIANVNLFEKQVGMTILALIVYGAIFIFFGTALKYPVIFGLLLAFGWEKITLIVPGMVRKFSVVHYLLSAFPKSPAMEGIINDLSRGEASSFTFSIVMLIAIAIIFFGLSIFTIYHKEYRFE